MNSAIKGALAIVLAGSLAAEAAAFDLTGTWQGSMRCKLTAGDVETRIEEDAAVLRISQSSDTDVFMELEGVPYDGVAFPVEGQPVKGTLGALRCENDGDAFTGAAEAIFFRMVLADPARDAFEISGISTMQSAAGAGPCKYKLSRVDAADPSVADCSAP